MPASNPNDRPRLAHASQVRSAPLQLGRALVALAACAACGGPPSPKGSAVATGRSTGAASANVVAAEAAPEASPPAATPRSCAVKTARLRPAADDRQHQCLEGSAPGTSDLQVTFTPRTPTVKPGGHVVLDIRITNVSDHTVSVRTELPLTEHLLVTTENGVVIAPPAGAMPIKFNPDCVAMTCSHVVIPRGVVVPLLPGGVIEDAVSWQASQMAWPAARLQDCLASCMGTDVVLPIATNPLAPGKYRVQATFRMWSEPQWLAPSANAEVLVR